MSTAEQINIKDTWEEYYQENSDTALKDKNLFSLEVEAIIKEVREYAASHTETPVRILEVGCGTGLFLQTLREQFPDLSQISITGIDLSEKAIERANKRQVPGTEFIAIDALDYIEDRKDYFDIIITQRSIMAIMDRDLQRNLLKGINTLLKEEGLVILSECFKSALDNINALRSSLEIEAIDKVWHSQYLDETEIQEIYSNVTISDFSSLYFLITRVISPHFEEPVHGSKIADFAAKLPQLGNFSFLKLVKGTKRK